MHAGFTEAENSNGRVLISVQGPWLVRAVHTEEKTCICEPLQGATKVSFTVERFLEEGADPMSWPAYWKQKLADAPRDTPERLQMHADFDSLWDPNNPHRLEEQVTVVFQSGYGPSVGVKGKVINNDD